MTPYNPERTVRFAGVNAQYKPTIMHVKDIEVLVDNRPGKRVLALQINPAAGASFIIPLPYDCAKGMIDDIAATLMHHAPELF